MLASLPIELIGRVQIYLIRKDLAQLSITCKYLYGASLPFLYKHLELGFYRHIHQLQKGVTTQSMLKQVIYEHTRKLTLRSRQNGNNCRTEELKNILGLYSKVEELIFCDFCRLSTQTIRQIVAMLPNIRHVQFKYCHIVDNPQQLHQEQQLQHYNMFYNSSSEYNQDSRNGTTCDTSLISNRNTPERVSYTWTDFTERSIATSLFPEITRLELGSNRNKYYIVNDHMVRSLYVHCPKITHLTITLPQVSYKSLCDTIIQYGKQLTYLSIQCDHVDVLLAIANHVTNIRSLTIRKTFIPRNSRDVDEESNYAMLKMIESCKQLEYLKIISCDIGNHVPNIVWECCLLSSDLELCFRAQAVLWEKRYQQQQENSTRQRRHGQSSTGGSVWFFLVTEEALAQRYHYMNSAGLRHKNDVLSNYTDLILEKSLLNEVRNQIKLLKGCNDCQSKEDITKSIFKLKL